MNDCHFRVIFQGLTEQAKHQRLALFFHKELGLPEERIRAVLTSPPRVLWHAPHRKDAGQIQEALTQLGCTIVVEPLVTHAPYPFAISQAHHQIIKRELSKVLRVQANLVLFLAQVHPSPGNGVLPSLMGDVQKQLAEPFRESDTVIGIDDFRSIILGFSTDTQGVKYVQDKLQKALSAIVGDHGGTSMGYALFPHEARSLQGLLHMAESRRAPQSEPDRPADALGADGDTPPAGSPVLTPQGTGATDSCIWKARGKAFKRLTDMDGETLWQGLHTFSQNDQRAFCARLPFDSPLAPVLEDLIDAGRSPDTDPAVEQHLEAIVHQIELDGITNDGRKQRKREILNRLKNAEALPTLPSIAAHIFKIASDSNSSAQDITRVIVNDPPLTSKLLKIVNSAFYGFPQKISTVKQAVVILGTEEIIDLSFGLAAAKAFDVQPIEGLGDPKQLWRHAISTGFIAQDLCKNLPQHQNLGAFTAGLLHDFGKIFLIDNYAQWYADICLDSARHDVSLFETEAEWLGLTHAFIGQSLATSWNLPEALCAAIAFHHEPTAAPAYPEFAAIIGLADYLYYRTEAVSDDDTGETTPPASLTVSHWSNLTHLFHNLNARKLDDMVERAGGVVKDSEGLFSLLEAD